MPGDSAIGWTEKTWNPVTGCSKVSPGCAHCYAETFAERWRGIPGHPYEQGFDLRLWPDRLAVPLRWRKPAMIFVNSMSDLFHEQVPDEYIDRVFAIMALAERHTFQVLTKRPERMRAYLTQPNVEDRVADIAWDGSTRADLSPEMEIALGRGRFAHRWPTQNVWLGVSIENRRFVSRADVLRATPAAVRFVSAEPLLGPLLFRCGRVGYPGEPQPPLSTRARRIWPDGYTGAQLDLSGIDWLIAGGESGPKHRRVDPEWIRGLRDACLGQSDTCDICGGFRRLDPMGGPAHHVDIAATTPCTQRHTQFFFKQWGGSRPNSNGRELDGRTWDEMPASAVVT